MNESTEHEGLLNDILSETTDKDFRARTLNQSLVLLHRRRRNRILIRATAAIVIPALIILCIVSRKSDVAGPTVSQVTNFTPAPEVEATESKPEFVPGTNIRIINDEELFALFAEYNQPIGFVGTGKNRRVILFNELDGVNN